MSNKITAEEIVALAKCPWADTKDVMRIGSCGQTNALKIKQKIRNMIMDHTPSEKRDRLPRNLVPMPMVLDYFHIDVDYYNRLVYWRECNGTNESDN